MTTGAGIQAAAVQPAAATRLCSRDAVGRRRCKQQAAGWRQQQPQEHTLRQRQAGSRRQSNAAALGSATAGEVEDQSVRVRIMLAESSGRLDLSECGLRSVPPPVFELEGLEELSLSGNQLTELPPAISRLSNLQRLQLAGNSLTALPDALGELRQLQGLWLHGNLLEALPPDPLGQLAALRTLSLSGNQLAELPESVGDLSALTELSCAGNRLARLPTSLGRLANLAKLQVHGNALRGAPPELGACASLQELWLQGNAGLDALPPELGALPSLRHLSAADCGLRRVPPELGAAPALESLSLYGNPALASLPLQLLAAPRLQSLWAEGCSLEPAAVDALLAALGRGNGGVGACFKALGLDASQAAAAAPALLAAAAPRLRITELAAPPPCSGYFKLETAAAATARGGDGGSSAGPLAHVGARAAVLVVAFGSAPGTPNWGGLLARVRRGASAPAEADFDVLYVVDPARGWYGGGCDETYARYEAALRAAVAPYRHVLLLGDSMGATAALMFAHLATSVQAFTPQVDLRSSSIRPGEGEAWFNRLRQRCLDGAAACAGEVVVHTGTWAHDLNQARVLPEGGDSPVRLAVYGVDSHRLALALDRRGRLEGLVRGAVLRAQGLADAGSLRLSNLF